MTIKEQISQIPRFAIRHIVGKLHVSTPDSEVRAEWNKRCDECKQTVTPYQRRRIIQYAVAAHRVNAKLYRDVMVGNFS